MFVSIWNRLWVSHHQVKDMFRFFVSPSGSSVACSLDEKDNLSDGDTSSGGDGGDHHRYNKSQLNVYSRTM